MRAYYGLLMMVALVAVVSFGVAGKSNQAAAQIAPKEEVESGQKQDILVEEIPEVVANNLITTQLELVEGMEVIVSHVEIPANTTLPMHWHPGEEFIYVLEGSGVMLQEGESDIPMEKGGIFKVPLRQIHTVETGEDSTTLLIFRIHEAGQPIRINVE